jgi:hypothetical protein
MMFDCRLRFPVQYALRICVVVALAVVHGCRASDEQQLPQHRLAPQLRLGDDEDGEAFQFTRISGVVQGPGAVYVAQDGQQEVLVFDLQGRYIRTIGRQGSGPGEFQGLQSIGVLGDTLWTIDVGLRRISVFQADGQLIATTPLEQLGTTSGVAGSYFFSMPMALLSDGTVLGFGGTTGRAIAEGWVTAYPLLRMTRSGDVLDTLGWVSIRNADMILRSPKWTMYRSQPFGDNPLVAYAAVTGRTFVIDRRCSGEASTEFLTVTALRTSGDTVWTRQHPYRRTLEARHRQRAASLESALRPRFSSEEIERGALRTGVSSA